MKKTLVGLVIPLYNEENRLEPGLTSCLKYVNSHLAGPFEVILVNDGSTDGTLRILEGVRDLFPNIDILIVSYSKNIGKGFAVKTGVLESTAEKLIVCDADFSIKLEQIDEFLSALDNYDVVIGSKKHAQTNTLVKQSPLRQFLGKAFTVLVNFTLGLNYSDITCGFKGFRATAAKELFSKQKTKRWSYDAEVLFLAKRRGYRIKEIPVEWEHVKGGSISPVVESFRSLKDLLLIVTYYTLGKYK